MTWNDIAYIVLTNDQSNVKYILMLKQKSLISYLTFSAAKVAEIEALKACRTAILDWFGFEFWKVTVLGST